MDSDKTQGRTEAMFKRAAEINKIVADKDGDASFEIEVEAPGLRGWQATRYHVKIYYLRGPNSGKFDKLYLGTFAQAITALDMMYLYQSATGSEKV